RINRKVVRAGHKALKKSPEEGVVARADSFVVETDVHFPADINLLLQVCLRSRERFRDIPVHQNRLDL
ncbi:MAG: hypothetical protein KZQ63_06345, partial [Candidatus Thiodiazotropha sp. (ex Lucinoma aequizonata)]|nr:hypothetical protein [Candidatus Thiodiazotropha sp. (ex Lucinoma aequizonata)]